MAQEPQISVPEELRDQVQEFSIRSNAFDVARRDYQVEVGKTLQALLKKVSAQAKEIADLKAKIQVEPEQPKVTP
jgi:hypothetical protein